MSELVTLRNQIKNELKAEIDAALVSEGQTAPPIISVKEILARRKKPDSPDSEVSLISQGTAANIIKDLVEEGYVVAQRGAATKIVPLEQRQAVKATKTEKTAQSRSATFNQAASQTVRRSASPHIAIVLGESLLLPDTHENLPNTATNPFANQTHDFFCQLLHSVLNTAFQNRVMCDLIQLFPQDYAPNSKTGNEILNDALQRFDGLIVVPPASEAFYEWYISNRAQIEQKPFVFVARAPGYEGTSLTPPYVFRADDRQGGTLAAQCLIDAGCTKCFIVSHQSENFVVQRARQSGAQVVFKKALPEFEVPVYDEATGGFFGGKRAGYIAAEKIFNEVKEELMFGKTRFGILSCADSTSVGLIEGLYACWANLSSDEKTKVVQNANVGLQKPSDYFPPHSFLLGRQIAFISMDGQPYIRALRISALQNDVIKVAQEATKYVIQLLRDERQPLDYEQVNPFDGPSDLTTLLPWEAPSHKT